MLMQVGGEGDRPTFFEMAAAKLLPDSLRAALLYSLGVIAQRRPIVHRLLDYSDEAFAVLMLVLEAHNLRTTDASFAEALYGLRRRPVEILGEGNARTRLSKAQRNLSIFFLVGLPYLKTKMQNAYATQRGNALQVALWGGDMPGSTSQSDTVYGRWKRKIMILCAKCFPWIHASHEGLTFAYELLYLLEATRYYSPALHLMRIQVGRASGQELMNTSKEIQERRKSDYQRLRGPQAIQAFQRGVIKSLYTALDYAQTGLVAAVFLFKMLEWWYQSAEERVMAPAVYPPPPPPPPPKVAENGVPLPSDVSICPLCLQKRTNPAMAAVSGYVFCYPCIHNYISQYKRCPVTLIPADLEQIRRLYHDS